MFCADESLKYEDFLERLGMPDEDLKRTLHSLACAKFRVLNKEPANKSINKGDVFTVNRAFTDRSRRVKVLVPARQLRCAEPEFSAPPTSRLHLPCRAAHLPGSDMVPVSATVHAGNGSISTATPACAAATLIPCRSCSASYTPFMARSH